MFILVGNFSLDLESNESTESIMLSSKPIENVFLDLYSPFLNLNTSEVKHTEKT